MRRLMLVFDEQEGFWVDGIVVVLGRKGFLYIVSNSFHWVGAYVARGHALPACDGGYTNIAHGAAGTPQPESP